MNTITADTPLGTRDVKPIYLYAPIDRAKLDDNLRIAEGYVFVNEVVEGEGGVRVKRSAMENATQDYMMWGATREMHGSNAAGTATADGCGVFWDNKGAYFRTKVVDDAAWAKVKEGVYKGFSIGVVPQVMRGKDVEKLRWLENSLVDRPADPDAKITVFRAEAPGRSEPRAEEYFSAVILPGKEEITRMSQATATPTTGGEGAAVLPAAAAAANAALSDPAAIDAANLQAAADALLAEMPKAVERAAKPAKAEKAAKAEKVAAADEDAAPLTRADFAALLSRFDALEAKLTGTPAKPAKADNAAAAASAAAVAAAPEPVQRSEKPGASKAERKIAKLKAKLDRMAAQPVGARPVVYTQDTALGKNGKPVARTFASNELNAADAAQVTQSKEQLRAEYQSVAEQAAKETDSGKRLQMATDLTFRANMFAAAFGETIVD